MQNSLVPWLLLVSVVQAQSDVAPPGIVSEKPATGVAVKIPSGFMAPYTEKIAGSDVQFEMIPVPGGEFFLGSPDTEPGHIEDEGPQVKILVPPLWVGKYEVTWAEYQQFMQLCDVFERFDDRKIRVVTNENEVDAVTAPSKLYDPSFTFASGEDPELPAVTMSQFAAKQYTKWLSLLTGEFYRLPSEAEWEYACRAGQATAYSFGNDQEQLDEYAWYGDNSDETSHPVGQKRPNGWGLYDMHGNISEWVLDGFRADWYGQLKDGTTADNALAWPERLYPRVLRGGSWQMDALDCRSAARRQSNDDAWRSYDPNSPKSPWWFASEEAQDVGFRIVRPLTEPPVKDRGKYWDADLEAIQRVVDFRIDKEGRGRRGLVDPQLPDAISSNASPEE
jgi:formylglycine-generating enzyme